MNNVIPSQNAVSIMLIATKILEIFDTFICAPQILTQDPVKCALKSLDIVQSIFRNFENFFFKFVSKITENVAI